MKQAMHMEYLSTIVLIFIKYIKEMFINMTHGSTIFSFKLFYQKSIIHAINMTHGSTIFSCKLFYQKSIIHAITNNTSKVMKVDRKEQNWLKMQHHLHSI
jgi:hypothetical protein